MFPYGNKTIIEEISLQKITNGILSLTVAPSNAEVFIDGKNYESRRNRIELKSGEVIFGNVIKVKTSLIEFKENKTSLLYEYKKTEIKYIKLVSGKIITFEGSNTETPAPVQQPVVIKENTSTGVMILAVIGGVLGFLLILGALAR